MIETLWQYVRNGVHSHQHSSPVVFLLCWSPVMSWTLLLVVADSWLMSFSSPHHECLPEGWSWLKKEIVSQTCCFPDRTKVYQLLWGKMEKTTVSLAGTIAIDDDGYTLYFLASTNILGASHLSRVLFALYKSFKFKWNLSTLIWEWQCPYVIVNISCFDVENWHCK